MIEAGLVEQGRGAWSFPVVLARKKNGDWRFCIDYRKLNHVTCKDAYPIPRIDESLDALGGSEWFTTLDLVSRYWQLPLSGMQKISRLLSLAPVCGSGRCSRSGSHQLQEILKD